MPSPLGQKIKTYRKRKRMTLDHLAAKTKSSKSYLWELEHRDTAHPSAEKIFAIAAALGVTPEFLLEDITPDADEAVLDEAFYRRYRRMPSDTKRRLRQILEAWDEEP